MKYMTQALLFILLFCNISTAQETASATAAGTFSVSSYFTVTRLADLVFGELVAGVNISIQPASVKAAQFLINGNGNSVVQVTVTFPPSLTCGNNTLVFNPLVPMYNTIPDALSAVQFSSYAGGSASIGTDGNLYVWVGGKILAAQMQPAGSYNGIIQLVVTQP